MKKMRKIIPALAMLVLSAVMLSTASFAWFSTATTVQANGVEVTAIASGGLIISTINNDSTSFTGASIADLSGEKDPLTPVTYATLGEATSATWWTASSSNPDTGILVEGTDSGANLAEDAEGYYIDYTVYIASPGETDHNTLTATVNWDDTSTRNGTTGEALSIAFYVQTIKIGTAVSEDGTLAMYPTAYAETGTGADMTPVEIAQKHGDNVGEGTNKNEYVIFDEVIPNAGAMEDIIAVTMRVYIDGDLTKDDNSSAYVNTTHFDPNGFGFDVTFTSSKTTAP